MLRLIASILATAVIAPVATQEPSKPQSQVRKPEFAFLALNVGDMGKSLAFYKDILGLTEQFRNETDDQIEVGVDVPARTSGPHLLLVQHKVSPGHLEKGDRFSRLAFYVADVEAICAKAASVGVPIIRAPVDNRNFRVKIAFIGDPDGNNVELLQPYD